MVHYPRTALISLTHTILRDLEAYWIGSNNPIPVSEPTHPPTSENNSDESESTSPAPMPNNPLSAIRAVRRSFDRKNAREEHGADNDEGFPDDIDAQYERDLALEEQYLFGPGNPGRPWVVDEAVKLYRETRFKDDSDEYWGCIA